MKKNTIAIIPARGGSKGIPRKNLKNIGGKPLIAWPIQLAKKISAIDRIIVSTDDDEIAKCAKKYGAEILFKRPKNLSGDNVSTLPVLNHTLNFLLKNENYIVENVLLLYPTSPFLKKERILEGIECLKKSSCDSVVGVREVRGLVWKKNDRSSNFYPFYPRKRVNRQLFSKLYEEAGNIFFTKANVILNQNKIVNEDKCKFIIVSEDEILDIDTLEDFKKAQNMLRKKIK